MSDPLNPYAPPAAEIDTPLAADGAPLTRAEVHAFTGKNGGYYWSRWQGLGLTGRGRGGFSWGSFFFQGYWLLYRRMYREAALWLAAVVASGVIEAYLSDVVSAEASRVIEQTTNFGFAFAMGFAGNAIYLRRARRAIATARALPDETGRLAALAGEGGTSWLSAFLGLIVTIALFVLLMQLE